MRAGRFLLFLLAAAFVQSACTGRKSALVTPAEVAQHPAAEVQKPPPQAADVTKLQPPAAVVTKRQPQVSPLRRKAVSLLEKKSYRQAVELMSGKNHEGMEKEFVQAINGLLEVGDDAFSLGDYAAAARAFKSVLDSYPAESSLKERISRDPKRLRSGIEACANGLMEQGLAEYRRGRLESAIRKWKGVLAITPGHLQAKKSLDTATVQLQALQDLKSR